MAPVSKTDIVGFTNPLRALLQPIQADKPFQKIAADLSELPVTKQGKGYVLVVIDNFICYINLFPLKDQHATTVV